MARAGGARVSVAVELLASLIRVPSVNPSIAPDEAGDERAIAAFACEWLASHGVRAWQEEAAPGRSNAVAEVRGGEGPTLVLCGHIDTVGTPGMPAPFEPRIETGRMYGRGAYDMKGGVAACMATAAALAGEQFGGTLMLALVADEEHASLGSQAYVARHRADACILTEPSEGDLMFAHKGFVWLDVVVRGRAAHGSRWDLGDSANARMGHVLAALDRFDAEVLRGRRDPVLGPASMHPALLKGGVGLSTYAPECCLQIERRTLPGETPDQVRDELAAVVHASAPDAEVAITLVRPAMHCDESQPIRRMVRDAITQVTGTAPREIGVGFWTDAALFAAAGIPTVDYGPTGAGAHEPEEWVEIASVERTAQVLLQAARDFFARRR
ncbi:MAG: M20/M25/M40 family metallo-hydrolase [Candidatus Eisenbacteria bacterium]|uniref:M20/M25/M40 family metallo-hydrolase n=1 Tax=Eiseniibacteriota bacterium TaxID=2212470 RepID=A0A849SZY9_UNCEI|nr:M20/M25/M40 family metallo-hydrolase [Candidatus Eisenbacteria bacterium]